MGKHGGTFSHLAPQVTPVSKASRLIDSMEWSMSWSTNCPHCMAMWLRTASSVNSCDEMSRLETSLKIHYFYCPFLCEKEKKILFYLKFMPKMWCKKFFSWFVTILNVSINFILKFLFPNAVFFKNGQYMILKFLKLKTLWSLYGWAISIVNVCL